MLKFLTNVDIDIHQLNYSFFQFKYEIVKATTSFIFMSFRP